MKLQLEEDVTEYPNNFILEKILKEVIEKTPKDLALDDMWEEDKKYLWSK